MPLRADASAENRQVKRNAVRASALSIATPSEWLKHMVEESQILGAGSEVRCVPNGVDTRIFRPGDKLAARRELGLPEDAQIGVFAAKGLKSSQFKGFETLTTALTLLGGRQTDAMRIFVALGEDAPAERIGGVELRYSAFLTDPEQVARYYQAADLYVHPALAENAPLAIIEAMACGTAVVASEVGGIPELVADGETGLLFPARNPAALADAVETLLGDKSRRAAMGAAALERVRERYTLERQVDAYLAWYDELMEERRASRS